MYSTPITAWVSTARVSHSGHRAGSFPIKPQASVGISRRVSKTATDRNDLRVCKRTSSPGRPIWVSPDKLPNPLGAGATGDAKGAHSLQTTRGRTRRPRHATDCEKGPRPASPMRFLIRQRLEHVQGRSIRGHWEGDLAEGSGIVHRDAVVLCHHHQGSRQADRYRRGGTCQHARRVASSTERIAKLGTISQRSEPGSIHCGYRPKSLILRSVDSWREEATRIRTGCFVGNPKRSDLSAVSRAYLDPVAGITHVLGIKRYRCARNRP